ncbi:protein of unknown function [Denitratisoma oestradiolicum]|uniref:Uncharacterized protein n=1 Tax=Denitratisoma oestradiolicum TaxID=311182 RepID=A0A6S6Y4Y5_9PROT|nr:protein of unknown function [Denitratisoma oestradiolicum]
MSDKYTALTPELYAYMVEHRSERPVRDERARTRPDARTV